MKERMLKSISSHGLSTQPSKTRTQFWFSLSLMLAVLYGLLVLQQAFADPYVVQDDARQHVFWMRRFLDPALFPDNLIADYFQSVAPWGYTTLYWGFAKLGIDPMLLAKLLPFGLGLATAAYGFTVSMQLLPLPFTAFLSSLLVQQVLWTHDDLASATPRAFMPLLFLAFLHYLLRRQLWSCLMMIALEGLFYPQYVFVFAGILGLQLVRWQGGSLRSAPRKDYWFCAAGLVVAFLVLLPFALTTSDYGPTINVEMARTLPEFNAGGRSRFFYDDLFRFWIAGNRSGLFPAFRPATIAIGILLPALLRFPTIFPLKHQITVKTRVLVEITGVALFLFFAAHAVLFKLHLPSRYTAYTLRYVLVFATAISLTLMWDAVWRWLHCSSRLWVKLGVWSLVGVMGIALLIYPNTIPDFPKTNYQSGKAASLYAFLAQQPADTVVASVLREADDIPSFSARSILVGREYAIPYHLGYANQFRQQVEALIRAQYSLDRAELTAFIQQYDIDFWLLNRQVFEPKFLTENWISQYPEAIAVAETNLAKGNPALKRLARRCTVFEDPDRDLFLVQADCMMQRAISRPEQNT